MKEIIDLLFLKDDEKITADGEKAKISKGRRNSMPSLHPSPCIFICERFASILTCCADWDGMAWHGNGNNFFFPKTSKRLQDCEKHFLSSLKGT